MLWTNYFEFLPVPNLVLYRYHVNVSPAAIGRKLTQIVRLLLVRFYRVVEDEAALLVLRTLD